MPKKSITSGWLQNEYDNPIRHTQTDLSGHAFSFAFTKSNYQFFIFSPTHCPCALLFYRIGLYNNSGRITTVFFTLQEVRVSLRYRSHMNRL